MKLQTQISLKQQENNRIDYNAKILLLGSCFSENIAEKFKYFKFQSEINPFGISFHVKAIERFIENAILKKEYSEKDVFFHKEQWHCFDAHSKLSNTSKEDLLKDLNAAIRATNQKIKESTHIIITLGTAWIYKYIKDNNAVANCHKVPQKEFTKELLSIEEITTSLQHIIKIIRQVNTKVAIIFTVSPVRHIKDGFIENTQSKAHLITAIHQIVNQQNQTYYFPSYEIMMDELRDYRFYKEDMLHPNKTAVNYIWERFKQVWITTEAQKTMQDVEVIQKGIQHKPFNPNSEAHLQFLQTIQKKVKYLKLKHPFISF